MNLNCGCFFSSAIFPKRVASFRDRIQRVSHYVNGLLATLEKIADAILQEGALSFRKLYGAISMNIGCDAFDVGRVR